jgi:FkbM family methyltransferase
MFKRIFKIFGYSFHKRHKTTNESEIIDLQIERLKPNIIIDCGANNGDFYKDLKKFKKKYIAFEPNPKLFNKLNKISQNDKKFLCFKKGTDKINCKKKIFLTSDTGQTLSSIKKQSPLLKENFKKTEVFNELNIELVSLYSMLVKLKISIKDKILLKLDTQGNDYETLLGLKNRIKQVNIIKIEMPVLHLYKNTKSHWKILDFLKKNKFEPVHFINGPRDKYGKIIEYDVIFTK